jgi:hypothetical protein
MKGKPNSPGVAANPGATRLRGGTASGRGGVIIQDLKFKSQQLLPLVARRWHKEFLQFIATGEASPGFFAYLDSDENCQRAVDKAIDAQAKIFQKLAETLRSHG